jgi:UDP-N-acetylmuramyl pentapeptide phosphotransferase/UDP-N-acetylglucosamine-1-phosphate transferase
MSATQFAIFCAVFLLAWWLTGRLTSPASRSRLLDNPNERSLHDAPKPRTGGLAILASLALGLALQAITTPLRDRLEGAVAGLRGRMAGAVLLLAAVSYWDDRKGLSPGVRLVAHLLAAAAIVLAAGLRINSITAPALGTLSLGGFGTLFTILFLVWITNLYNFMDGMDGLAAGMTVLGCGFLAAVAAAGEGRDLVAVPLVVAGAAGGFLLHNLPPARIFMGDTGSVSLGFLVGTLSVWFVSDGLCDLWVPVLVFSPFIVDATVTLVRRLVRGEKPWQAHREHYYQRLVLAGWGQRKTVLAEYALMAACGASALVSLRLSEAGRLALLSSWALVYVSLAAAVRAIERRARRRASEWTP